MCLYNDYDKAVKFVEKQKKLGKKYIWAWKVVNANNYSPLFIHQWKVGENKSNSRYIGLSKQKNIHHGFHVYLCRDQARKWINEWEKIIKVKCYIKDLIGISILDKEAVFSKVVVKSLKHQH
jgi:hypothetical protein